MHLAEGILPASHALGWTGAAVPLLVWSLRGEQKSQSEDPRSSIVIAGTTSLLFAATMLPLPVPVVGATSHLCLTPILSLVVGLRRIFWPTFFVVLLQAMLFGHGGLTTLGVNSVVLGLIGPAITIGLWRTLKGVGVPESMSLGVACGLGALSIYVADALVLAAALSDLAEPSATFMTVVVGFAPVQLPLMVVEAIVSVAIIRMLVSRRPGILPISLRNVPRASLVSLLTLMSFVVIGLGGCGYQPVDESVFDKTAEQLGRPPIENLIQLGQGRFTDYFFGISFVVALFIAWRCWRRLARGADDALPR